MNIAHCGFWVLLAAIGAADSLADAPASVGGMIYRLTERVSMASNPSRNSQAIWLKEDGSYVHLYSVEWGLRHQPRYSFREPSEGGTYLYQKTGPMAAKLAFVSAHSTAAPVYRDLAFTSDLEGDGLLNIFFPSAFRFSPVSEKHPLVNLSTRVSVSAGKPAIVGFAVPAKGQSLLIRAVGPGLQAFGVTGYLKYPSLVYPSVAGDKQNDGWEIGNSVTSVQRLQSLVGAFPLEARSKDAVLILDDIQGPQTVVVQSNDPADAGEVLVEVYLIP